VDESGNRYPMTPVADSVSSPHPFALVQARVQAACAALIVDGGLPAGIGLARVAVEPIREASHGEIATNAAMVLAKEAKAKPRDLAEQIALRLRADDLMAAVEVAGPGFINLTLKPSAWVDALRAVLREGETYGRSTVGVGERVNVGYVCANPTGPIHVSHCRGAVFGDALASLLAFAGYDVIRECYISDAGPQADMEVIRDDLAALGIKHDFFFSERSLVETGNRVAETIDHLRCKDHVYEGRLTPKGMWVQDYGDGVQTLFRADGGDVDWPLGRGFLNLVDVRGADRGGHIKPVRAAIKALTEGRAELDVRFVQQVRLLRHGEPLKPTKKTSKRCGDFVTLREVVDEVGSDAMRFTMLQRKNDAALDFDVTKVIEQSKDNAVFYVQYGHALGHSVFRNAREVVPGLPESAPGRAEFLSDAPLERLEDPAERGLMRRLALYPRIIEAAASALEPHRIAVYVYDLASDFHALWTRGGDLPHLRFIINNDARITKARLAMVQGVVSVLASGLAVLGVRAPDEIR
jgi:arginyl-tRNA synthetase